MGNIGRLLPGGLLVAVVLLANSVQAGTFSWGDLSDPNGDVMYLNVTENNGEAAPLFDEMPGTGSPDVVGNQIFFNPQSFSASASGGASDLIDSTLTTVVMAKAGKAIDNISFDEAGDYTLQGLAGGNAMASVGAAFFVTVLEVDGVATLLPTQTLNMQFTTGSGPNGGTYSRPGDDGTAVVWKGNAFIDVNAMLNDLNVDGSATKVQLRFDNTLTAAADAVSSAFIKKKVIDGVIVTINKEGGVPEPGTVVLAVAGLVSLLGFRRFR